MKWICRRDRSNSAVWIAVMVVIISSQGSIQRHHLSAAWLAGLLVGLVATVAAAWLIARRKGGCR